MLVNDASRAQMGSTRATLWLPVGLAVLVWLPSLFAPALLDERVMTYEARKWIGLDPIAPWLLPVGGSGIPLDSSAISIVGDQAIHVNVYRCSHQ